MIDSRLRKTISEVYPEFLKGLTKIMKIRSVKSKEQFEAPFGEGPKEALLAVMQLADELGFQTRIVGNAVGYAQLGEDNQNYIAVVGHLDVVREGTDWDYPPFDLSEDSQKFYGRGILDNKGPIMANLYALYVLKKMEYPLTKTIRIIFGTDEESGSADIPLYLEKELPPIYGYTPDCKYPAVYGERGILGIRIQTAITDESDKVLSQFEGNFDRSIIPDILNYQFNKEDFSITGKRSPSNAPELGENVITMFAEKEKNNPVVKGEFKDYLGWLADALHKKHDGSGLSINFCDQESGSLALTPYSLAFDGGTITLDISIRYPITVSKEDIMNRLMIEIPEKSQLSTLRELPATNFDKNHPMIKTMTKVYEELTDFDGTPVTTTGATYARVVPNIVAFGPSFPGQKGIAHNKNEYMDKKDLQKNFEIYAYLLAELGK